MKKKILTILFATVMLMSMAGCGGEKEMVKDEEFKITQEREEKVPRVNIVNALGFDVCGLYLSGTGEEEWKEAELDKNILSNGKNISIELAEEYESYDIRVEDEEGNEMIFEDYDLSSISNITLTVDKDGNAKALIE